MLELNHYFVLFTGGLDSTYRLCQLARDEKAVIQPIYIVFPDNGKSPHVRPELQREIEAQDKILDYLVSHPNTKAKILPIKRIQRDEIPKDQRILDLEGYLAEYMLGWQYLYFAMLKLWLSNLELCHEDYMNSEMKNKLFFKIVNHQRVIDSELMDNNFVLIFQNLSFPIFGTTRLQMVAHLKEWGFSKILKNVFFCYKTINGKPCGFCDNCRGKIEQGLKDLFDKEAIHRYLVYRFVQEYEPSAFRVCFEEYIDDKNNFQKKINEDRDKRRFFKIYDKLFSMSDFELKRIIINGTLKYGCRTSIRDKVSGYKQSLSRKHMLDFLGRI